MAFITASLSGSGCVLTFLYMSFSGAYLVDDIKECIGEKSPTRKCQK